MAEHGLGALQPLRHSQRWGCSGTPPPQPLLLSPDTSRADHPCSLSQGLRGRLLCAISKHRALWQQFSEPEKEAKGIFDYKWLLSACGLSSPRLGAPTRPRGALCGHSFPSAARAGLCRHLCKGGRRTGLSDGTLPSPGIFLPQSGEQWVPV